MNKDYRKILWRIEEFWEKFYHPKPGTYRDIVDNYKNGVSKYHDRFHQVKHFDFSPSKEIIFSDDYGEYFGLERCQVLEKNGKLIYLFDNHNEMLYPMVELSESSNNQFDIVHIDAHPDDADFQGKKSKKIALGDVHDYITGTRISDFFDAISETNLIGGIYRVTHSDSLEFFTPPEKPYILSLDIDIFGPEGDFADLTYKVQAIASAWGSAEAICIATSPGFIDQGYAKSIINILLSK